METKNYIIFPIDEMKADWTDLLSRIDKSAIVEYKELYIVVNLSDKERGLIEKKFSDFIIVSHDYFKVMKSYLKNILCR